MPAQDAGRGPDADQVLRQGKEERGQPVLFLQKGANRVAQDWKTTGLLTRRKQFKR